jgi:hypothetical protein
MGRVGNGLFCVLFFSCFQGAATAQSAFPQDPLFELVQSIAPRQVVPRSAQEIRAEYGAIRSARRPTTERRRHSPKNDESRMIRAKAEITIVDDDHVVVRLTRRGIGGVSGTSTGR